MLRKLFESRNNSVWLIMAFVVMMMGMLVAIFAPMVTTLSRFQWDTKIGFSPSGSAMWFMFLAFLALTLGCYFIYKLSNKSQRITAGILGVFFFGLISFISYNQYIYVDNAYIEVGTGFGGKQYAWTQVKEASYYSTADGIESYVLKMDDSKEVEVVFGGLLNSGAKVHIRRSVEAAGIVVVDKRDL